ncbi:MAG TPA: rod shape-determining protein MreC [Ferruginibacter sp.]|nr:rod shape-determining protein MreC [Ferruginibacter sp.]
MRNIFFFIRRYFNFLFFLILQVICILLIVHYSNFHKAVFSGTANRITGTINKEYNKVEYYFQLKKTNDSLVKANEVLYNQLKSAFNLPDSTSKTMIDTIMVDSVRQYRTYSYLHVKVVANSVAAQNNFIVISGSNVHQLRSGMGVVDANNAAIGIITEVSGEYAVVMSLLHKDSHISGKLLKGGETGTLNWDGKEPNIITLTNIPKSAKVSKGDTIITSGFSTSFPKGISIGRVEAVFAETATNNFKIKFRTLANFYNLQYAYAINNLQQEPVNNLLEKVKKQQ